MIVVADASPLVALAECDALEFLTSLFHEIKIPKSVYDEVTVQGKPHTDILANFLRNKISEIDLTQYHNPCFWIESRRNRSNGIVSAFECRFTSDG